MRAHLLALALAVPALAACSSGDEAASADAALSAQDLGKQWQAAAEKELGTEVDLESLQREAAVDCQRTDLSSWIVALGTAGDLTGSEVTRLGLQHVCPEVEKTFAEAVEKIEDASDVNELVCAQPVAKLDGVERMKLDFIC